jgi:hypothetical protein
MKYFIINDIDAITLRRIEPMGVDRMSVEAWALAPAEEGFPEPVTGMDAPAASWNIGLVATGADR